MERAQSLKPLHYPVPWESIYGLWPCIVGGLRTDLRAFTESVVARMDPPPRYLGMERLPRDPRFLVIANHYQRKGMWILHPASAITVALSRHYGGLEPGARWVVTENWPRWRVAGLEFPSPGDILLPRVAHALWCYAIPFAGSDPRRTARAFRQLLRESSEVAGPLGLFPEGVAGAAGELGLPLPGVERLIALLAKGKFPVVPVAIREAGRLVIEFGERIGPDELLRAPDAAQLSLQRVGQMLRLPHS